VAQTCVLTSILALKIKEGQIFPTLFNLGYRTDTALRKLHSHPGYTVSRYHCSCTLLLIERAIRR